MKATAGDIRFAHQVECALRNSIRVSEGMDLYAMLLNAERRRMADLYRDCVVSMKATGEFSMPSEVELADAKAKAWAVLEEEA